MNLRVLTWSLVTLVTIANAAGCTAYSAKPSAKSAKHSAPIRVGYFIAIYTMGLVTFDLPAGTVTGAPFDLDAKGQAQRQLFQLTQEEMARLKSAVERADLGSFTPKTEWLKAGPSDSPGVGVFVKWPGQEKVFWVAFPPHELRKDVPDVVAEKYKRLDGLWQVMQDIFITRTHTKSPLLSPTESEKAKEATRLRIVGLIERALPAGLWEPPEDASNSAQSVLCRQVSPPGPSGEGADPSAMR